MIYQNLGTTDISVSKISLGTWGLGGGSVWTDKDSTVKEATELLSACLDSGINYIDTAPVYGTGESERLLGEALKGRRNDFVLQTKCSLNWRNEGGNFHYERDGYTVNNDTSYNAVIKDVEDSLIRMQTDYIDSVIVHYVTQSFPTRGTVEALEKLRTDGKIRTYGLSNSQEADLIDYSSAAMHISNDVHGPSLVQEFFSILSPFHGRDYFEVCKKFGTTFQTYGVLEEGYLTGPEFLEKTFAPTDIRSRIPWVKENYRSALSEAYKKWESVRAAHGCSFAALFTAWALTQYEKINVLVGMRKTESVKDIVNAVSVKLSKDEISYLEDVIKDIQVKVLDK